MPADYRRFLAGMLLGDFALQVQSVAVGWQVFSLDRRPLDLGLVGLTLFLPTFTLWFAAGIFADRHDRRLIASAGAFAEAALSLALAALVVAHTRALWPYLVILLAVGIVRAFGTPAERSLLPAMIPRNEYLRAQANYSSLRELAQIAGPAAGGALVALGTPVAFAASTVLLVVSAGILARLRVPRTVHVDPPTWCTAFDGLRYVIRRRVIAGAISLDLFAVLFGGSTALLPVYADVILHVGPMGLGVLRSAPAVGAAAVAAVLARHPPERRVGSTLLVAVTGFGLATIVFGLSRNFILSLAMLAIVGGADMVSVVIRNGLVQLGTPNAMRGRVNAVENVFIGASNELGAFESGTLAAFIGTVPSVVAGGAATLAVIALWALAFPSLRRADRMPRADPPGTPELQLDR